MNPLLVLSVALGGAAGATARFAISYAVHLRSVGLFPWGTLIANILGCFLLGAFFQLSELVTINPNVKAMISVGLIGALTTFSTFTLESLNLIKKQEWIPAIVNIGVSLAAGFAACIVGICIVRQIAKIFTV